MLRTQPMNVLLAGRDTTASLLSNLWIVLARRPDIWAKLKEEVNQLNYEKPSYQQLNAMKYLRHCINESLRLNPPVPMNNREAIHDTVLPRGGGPDGTSPILVPAGSMVGWHCYSMHRTDRCLRRRRRCLPTRAVDQSPPRLGLRSLSTADPEPASGSS
jgi:cytochrome P450